MEENIYEKKSINKLIFTFSIPAIFSLIIEILTSVVDTIFAGHLGVQSINALSAMGLLSPILSIFTALQTLFAVPTAIMLAKYLRDKEVQSKYYFTGFLMTLFISFLTSCLVFVFLTPSLKALGAKGEVFNLASQYLKIQLISNIFSSIGYTLTSSIRSFGYPKIETIIVTLSVIINVIMNFLFTFIFSMGIKGIALGTLISEVVCAFISIAWLIKKDCWFKVEVIKINEFFKMVFSMFKIGIAQSLIMMLGSFTGFIANNRLLYFGAMDYIAAWNISQRIYTLVMMPIVGIAQSVQTILAYFEGNSQEEKSQNTIKLTIMHCAVYGIISTIIMFFFGNIFLNIFGATQEIYSIANQIIKIIFLTFPLIGILYTAITLLQVIGKEVSSVILGLTRQLFSIVPLMIFLPIIFSKLKLGINPALSIFLSIPLADIISTLLAVIFLEKTLKRKVKKPR